MDPSSFSRCFPAVYHPLPALTNPFCALGSAQRLDGVKRMGYRAATWPRPWRGRGTNGAGIDRPGTSNERGQEHAPADGKRALDPQLHHLDPWHGGFHVGQRHQRLCGESDGPGLHGLGVSDGPGQRGIQPAAGAAAGPGRPLFGSLFQGAGDLWPGLSFRGHLCAAGRAAVHRLVSVLAHAAGRAGARRHRQRVCHRLRQPLPHPGLQGKPAKGLLGVLADHAPGLGDGAGGRLSVRPHGPGAHVCHQRRQLPGRGPVRNADPRAGGTPGPAAGGRPAARLCGGPGPGRALYPRRARVAGHRRLLHPQRPAGRLLAADAALLQGYPGPWRAVVHLCGRLRRFGPAGGRLGPVPVPGSPGAALCGGALRRRFASMPLAAPWMASVCSPPCRR